MGQFVDRDTDTDVALGDVLVVRRPLHNRPRDRSFLIGLVGGECSQWFLTLDVPNDILETFIIRSVECVSYGLQGVRLDVGTGHVGPSDDVVLTRRELHESDVGVGELEEIHSWFSIEVWSTP